MQRPDSVGKLLCIHGLRVVTHTLQINGLLKEELSDASPDILIVDANYIEGVKVG